MLRYLGGGMALAVLLGAVAACDGRAALLNAVAESSLSFETGARVTRGEAAVLAEPAGGDSLAVLIEWHVDSVRRHVVGQCRPDDQPPGATPDPSQAVLDGPESAQIVGAKIPVQHGSPARPTEGNTCTGVHFLPSRPWLACP